ncbi:hypothetical protein KW796_00740 [Candidatus Parcubacteria bacterium]|nr:hypothetical protein [Candidatus Parcubacteria bacterium]
MTQGEKGSASGVVIGVVAFVVLVLAVFGVYAYKNPVEVSYGNSQPETEIIYVATTTTSYVSTTTTLYNRSQATAPATKPRASSSGQSASAYIGYSGTAYRNASFGLTVPGSHSVTVGRDAYAGVSDTASLHFYQGGVHAFQINVWSKEQWNDIRIQETMNAKQGTGPTYFGEGSYLGENKTWIFSVIPGSSIPSGVQFFAGGSSTGSAYMAPTPASYSPIYETPASAYIPPASSQATGGY